MDAVIIRRLTVAEHAHLRPYRPATVRNTKLALLQKRRASTVKCRQALNKSLHQVGILATPLQRALSAIDDLLASIDRQTSNQLAVLFSWASLTAIDAAAAFIGLDPKASDSGQKQGRRLSKHGPSEFKALAV